MKWQIVQGVPCLHPLTPERGPSRPRWPSVQEEAGVEDGWLDILQVVCCFDYLNIDCLNKFKNVTKILYNVLLFIFVQSDQCKKKKKSLPMSFSEVKVHVIFNE